MEYHFLKEEAVRGSNGDTGVNRGTMAKASGSECGDTGVSRDTMAKALGETL